MKKISLFVAVILPFSFTSFAQTKTLTVDANDALNSNTKIIAETPNGQIFFTGHQLGSGYANPLGGIFRAWTDNPNGASNYFYDGVTNGTTNFSVRADGQGYFAGSVGIGTSAPNANLEVNGTIILAGANSNLDRRIVNRSLSFLENSGKTIIGWNRTAGGGETDFIGNQSGGSPGGFAFYNHDNSGLERQLMWITGDGRLFVGLSEAGGSGTGNNKLAVGGGIIAESVTVKLQGNWPDYVFDQTYEIKSLPQLEAFIKKYKHLPEIPSANDVSKNGIELGEMNSKLLKKIEELTLMLIEQNKRIVKLESGSNSK